MKAFKIAALASALSLGLMLTSNGANAACDKMEKVIAVWLPIMQTTAYYVALEEKLFEKACIEIVSQKLEAPNQIIDALVAARADFGPPGAAAGIAMLAESKFPGTFKVFGLQGGGIKVNLINDGLIVKKGSTIKTFADLKGKKLGHIPGIQWRTISRHMVRSAGLDPQTDVTLLDLAVGMQMPAVVGGSVDATLSLEPVGSIAIASGQAMRAMINPVAMVIADPFYSGVSLLDRQIPVGTPAGRAQSGRGARRGDAHGQRQFRQVQDHHSEIHADPRAAARAAREALSAGIQRAQRRRSQFLPGAGRRVPEGKRAGATDGRPRSHPANVRFQVIARRCP